MKVLFASSGNSHYGIVPFIKNQGESLRKKGIQVDFFPVLGHGISGYLKNAKKLKKQVKSKNYDVIHAHYSLIGLVAMLALTKKPIVVSLMGSDAYGDYDINGKRKSGSYFPMLVTQLIQPFVNAIVVKSENILKYVYRKNIASLVPNGVDFNRFKPMDKAECRKLLNLPQNKSIILYLANSEDPRKNYQLLEKSIPHIKKKYVEIINPYPIKNEDFPLYLNACDVFVLTSYNEGSPNVIKEAMACDCPIVSTDVGDVKKVIKGAKGCFLTSFDEIDLADKIDKALLLNTRTSGRKHIDHLREEKIAEKLINIYKSTLKHY